MISAWQNQTDRFLGFISLSVPWCEQREWSSRCAQIILQHRGPPPLILLCRSFGVWWWWGSVSQSSMLLEMDGSHTHTHKHTSARPHLNPETANQLQASSQTLHLHYAWSRESWEAAAESSSLRMFTPPCVCVCAWPCLGVQTWAPLRETVLFLPPATLQPIRDNKDEINKYWWL